METVIALVVGIGIALIFGAGAGVNHALEKAATAPITIIEHVPLPPEVTTCVTAEEHRTEASRLLVESLYIEDLKDTRHLQAEAYRHFRTADILDNGPYKV